MKIVHLCQYYMVGQTYQENYLPAAMARLGHEVTVVAGTQNPDFYVGPAHQNGDTLTDRGVTVRFTTIHYKSLYTPVDDLYKILAAEAPDLIFVHGFILTRCFALARYAARHKNCILGADTHETYVLAFNACFTNSLKDRVRRALYFGVCYRIWAKYVQKRYKKIFYVTPPRKKYAVEAFGFSEENLESLWLGADFSSLPYANKEALRGEKRKALGLAPSARLIVLAGKLDEKKRPAELAEAFARLDAPDWNLVFVGSISDELKAAVRNKAGETNRVFFTGLVPGDEALNWIAAADIAAYPGAHSVLWEETAALGVPAVYYAPEAGDAEYLSNDSAYFVRFGTPDEIEACLRALLGREAELSQMGERARELALASLDYDMLAKKCLGVLTAGEGTK